MILNFKKYILERNVWVLFCSYGDSLSGQWSMPKCLLLISHCNGLQFQKVLFWKEMYEFYFYLTGDYGCCSQWSVIRYAQFFFNYLFLFLDKSVYCLNFTLQWSPVSKSTILERNVWVLFLANWWLWMLLSVVSDQVCPVFL